MSKRWKFIVGDLLHNMEKRGKKEIRVKLPVIKLERTTNGNMRLTIGRGKIARHRNNSMKHFYNQEIMGYWTGGVGDYEGNDLNNFKGEKLW